MKLLVRVDSSARIGSGHVMRCLTLARKLTSKGAEIAFCCRPFPGNLIDLIASEFPVYRLSPGANHENEPDESCWLGGSQAEDASQTRMLIQQHGYDAVLVDHYSIDSNWESEIKPLVNCLAVIDDLANRPHHADILLDQTLGRKPSHYHSLVPKKTRLLCGVEYALLRDEFFQMREKFPERIPRKEVDHILITFGGADINNLTELAIEGLMHSGSFLTAKVEVIVGASNPHIESIKSALARLEQKSSCEMGITDMAQRMVRADLCIGAAGSTSWERCVLGLPTLMAVQAQNQAFITEQLAKEDAVIVLDKFHFSSSLAQALNNLEARPDMLVRLSVNSSKLCDGLGSQRVAETVKAMYEREYYEAR
ncbi:UDP-2,4-diacetamido-2,4,6-trideoxy-beta-L-altropyranose hydrolase [Pseudidiomarina salinarum]|uniref:UDP-2,4-diacetamido-2,4, 6-trideoxy-beta-L-altropyranose hydrolase n=1 Tax=Pseudidiomarina salinarum TaxID=435908 RepID=UPI00068FECD9|nr:UDP-2,4-diacetamido-2,4,6-trideoxy-beta-L-altropyranose hydrolase [Pseudidiomarina salinarum]